MVDFLCRAGALRISEAAKGEERRFRELPVDVVRYTLGFIPPLVAASPGLQEVTIWSGQDKRKSEPFPRRLQNDFRVADVKFSPSGEWLAAIGPLGVMVWDAWAGRPLHELHHSQSKEHRVYDAQVFPDGDRLVTLGSDRRAAIWRPSIGELLLRIVFHELSWQHDAVHVAAGDTWVVTAVSRANADRAVAWNATSGRAIGVLLHSGEKNIAGMVTASCGAVLGMAGRQCVSLWHPAQAKLARSFCRPSGVADPQASTPLQMAISEDGARVVGSLGRQIFLWDGRTGELLRTVAAEAQSTAIVFLPGGVDRFLTLTPSRLVVWNGSSGESVHVFDSEDGEFNVRVAAASSGGVVAACSERRMRPPRWSSYAARRWSRHPFPPYREHPFAAFRDIVHGGRAGWGHVNLSHDMFHPHEWRQIRVSIVDVRTGRVLRKEVGPGHEIAPESAWRTCTVAVGPPGERLLD